MKRNKNTCIVVLLTLVFVLFIYYRAFFKFSGKINVPIILVAIISFIYSWFLHRLLKLKRKFIIVIFFFVFSITHIGTEIIYRILINRKLIFYGINIDGPLAFNDKTEEQRLLIDRYLNDNSYNFSWIVGPLVALVYCIIILFFNYIIKFVAKIFKNRRTAS
jgi:hypothetical protein